MNLTNRKTCNIFIIIQLILLLTLCLISCEKASDDSESNSTNNKQNNSNTNSNNQQNESKNNNDLNENTNTANNVENENTNSVNTELNNNTDNDSGNNNLANSNNPTNNNLANSENSNDSGFHDQGTPEKLRQHVEFLAELNPPRSGVNIDSLNIAAEYIFNEFTNAGGEDVQYQEFLVGNKTYKNVRAFFGPETDKIIVVGAHYDAFDPVAGADDNASAVAGLIALSHMVSEITPNHRLEFVAYTLEEPPYYNTENMGSVHHAKYIKNENIEVEIMICLEMIGYYTDEPNSQDYPLDQLLDIYGPVGNFLAIIGKMDQAELIGNVHRLMQGITDLQIEWLPAPDYMQGIDFSDHRSYWAEGYPAVMVTDTGFYRNKNYHTLGDTPDTLDYSRMAMAVKAIFNAVSNY